MSDIKNTIKKRYYVTTPIYYVNGEPHVGTATTTLIADAITRYRRLRGEHPYFLTGTDEWARKVAEAAEKSNEPPQRFVDRISQRFVDTWKYLGIDYDRFIRTTDIDHIRTVQAIFSRLKADGDIYLGVYEGWYSVNEETFYRDTDVNGATGRVIETDAVVERVREETYFFRLSAYAERLTQYIGANADFLQPETRKNEVLSFIEQGLRDVAVTQNRDGWGIPVPDEAGKVIYVWFDALINYLTATGWSDGDDSSEWRTLWPADVHLMAKEIYTRFHATLWPAMLMALGLPLPKHIVGHGWWTVGGEKGSKSKGNIPSAHETVAFLQTNSGAPEAICIDALRYYLLRDIRFSDDSEFSREMLVTRYNSDLANDLGNVLNRVLRATYFDGTIPTTQNSDNPLKTVAAETVAQYQNALERFDWGNALQAVWVLIGAANKYLDENAPWTLAKNGDTAALGNVVYNVLEATRIAAYLISPVMPNATAAIAEQLGIRNFAEENSWETATKWGGLVAGSPIGIPTPLFPRIDTKKLAAENAQQKKEKKPMSDINSATERAAEISTGNLSADAPSSTAAPDLQTPEADLITIEDFQRVQLRVADITAAEKVSGAKKLLRLQLNIGGETRQIVSGIADAYTPDELVGRQIVVVYNLEPAVIRGVESMGMLLAATDADGKAILLQPDKKTGSGSKVR